jgi:hypothetical protein
VADTRTIRGVLKVDQDIRDSALPLHRGASLNTLATETRKVPGGEHAMTRVNPLFAGSVPKISVPENAPCIAIIGLPCQIPTGASVVGTVTTFEGGGLFRVGE